MGVAAIKNWLPDSIEVPISAMLAKNEATSLLKAVLAQGDQTELGAICKALKTVAAGQER